MSEIISMLPAGNDGRNGNGNGNGNGTQTTQNQKNQQNQPNQPTGPTTTSTTTDTVQKSQLGEQSNVGPPTPSLSTKRERASDQTAPGEPRPRPVFKMRRTGHSGPFPFSGRPVLNLSTERVGSSSPGGQASASPSTGGGRRDAAFIPNLQGLQGIQGLKVPSGGTNSSSGSESPSQSDANNAIHLTSASTLLVNARASSNSTPNPAKANPTKATFIVDSERDLTMGSSKPFSPLDARATPHTTPATKISIPPKIQQIFKSALDDQPYRSWTDELGQTVPTAGALLPAGYKKSDNADFPWLCPVRSCRKMLPSLAGLGKHFCNSHRAVRLNDNLDGTLSDLGTYADSSVGDGKSSGGYAKPALLVSKQPMSLAEAPMAEPSLHYRAMFQLKGTVPQRGGPRRRAAVNKAVSTDDEDDDDDDDEDDFEASEPKPVPDSLPGDRPPPLSPTGTQKRFDMANPDRPYKMWFNDRGELAPAYGALIPDGYKQDTTVPDRPWICPVRRCRRLFLSRHDLGLHFKKFHRGYRLNDNLDGTFSVVGTTNDGAPPVVVSRDPMDLEPIGEPQRPIYPGGLKTKNVVWVSAVTGKASPDIFPDTLPDAAQTERSPDHDLLDVVSDVGIELATDGRPYGQWWGDSGELVNMAGALIPGGYELDKTIDGRPWICPIRSCRVVCKFRRALGYHFTKAHKSEMLNDNGDGTLSVVGSHDRHGARVVSRRPLDPNEPAMMEPRLLLNSLEGRMAESERRYPPKPPVPPPVTITKKPPSGPGTGNPGRLWSHICSCVDGELPSPWRPEIKALLSLPQKRRLITAEKFPADISDKQIAGLAIQATGEENENPCTECRRHDGPFASCVSNSAANAPLIIKFMGTSSCACGNCVVRVASSRCSLRKLGSLSWATAATEQVEGEDTPGLGDVDAAGEEVVGRRRSQRVTATTNSFETWVDEAEDEASVVADEPSEPKRKIIKFRIPPGRVLRERSTPTRTAKPVPGEANLRMEDWEMGDGRITAVATGDTLAFSTNPSHPQTHHLSPILTITTTRIPSGSTHTFLPSTDQTRVCTLVSSGSSGGGGKLKVQVEGEEEFAIGAGGVFRIAAGTGCVVMNRCYVDVGVQVVAVRES